MKMRVGVLGFSLGLILIYLCVSKMLINDTTDHNAAVWRNEVLMKVESGIKKGIITEDTKEYQGVIIVFRSDTEYFNKLNKSLFIDYLLYESLNKYIVVVLYKFLLLVMLD